jgi:protein-serine/threonine kinase
MLKGLLMRRQSSQVSGETEAPSPEMTTSPILPGSSVQPPGGRSLQPGAMMRETVYGDPTQDQGDEVRFYVELTRLDGLKDTYSIDIRRLKGNLRSYKFLYDCITECVYIFLSTTLLFPLNLVLHVADALSPLQPPRPATVKGHWREGLS